MLDQRRRRWADIVQMLYKYFVFAGTALQPEEIDLDPLLLIGQDHDLN